MGQGMRCEPRHSRSESIWGLMDNGEPLRLWPEEQCLLLGEVLAAGA